ncbi:MAG: GFA family protein [Defluviicoccus sp.]|nr:GFA family protein [Defluviicoccus sp.]MDE0386740.1 GFA family protein [Defluviicoccus sp.]
MKRTWRGSCHCGKARFEIDVDIDHVRVCNCSVCHMRAALIHRVPEDAVRLLTPLEDLTLYRWGSHTAEDYSCPDCGILPFRRPSYPTEEEMARGIAPFSGWAVNTRCLADFDAAGAPVRPIDRLDTPVEDVR